MILAVSTILGSWLVIALVFAGVGLLARRAFVSDIGLDAVDVLEAFWVGYAATLLFLQLWHLALPISWLAAIPMALAGAGGLWVTRSQLRASTGWTSDRRWGWLAVLVPLVLWVAILATSPIRLHDTGLYHRPTAEWYKSYPIVPGLANLHPRLGYNSSHLLYTALADSFLPGRAEHVVNGPLALALLVQLMLAGWRSIREQSSPHCFDVVLLTPAVFLLLGRDLTSFGTDFALMMILFAAIPRIHRYLSHPPPAEDLHRFRVAASTFILCTAVAVKLTAAALVVPVLLVLLGVRYRRVRAGRQPTLRVAFALPLGICVLMAGVWIGRSIILSGYPAYPLGFGAVPVSWRVPESVMNRHALVANVKLRFFFDGRSPDELVGETLTGGWFREWLRHLLNQGADNEEAFWRISLPLILASIAILIGLATFVRPRAPPREAAALLLPASGLALLVWIFRFPDPRYGTPIAWVFAGIAVAELSRLLAIRGTGSRVVVAMLLGLASIQAVWPARLLARVREISVPYALAERLVAWPWPGELTRARSVPLREFDTDSGLRLYQPIRSRACWRAPLTCTPVPRPDLRLRVAGELRFGFEGGEWRARSER